MTQLTPHFSLEELCFSETATRMGRVIVPPHEIVANLTSLCKDVLEPMRVRLGRPMVITSGYRPSWLNTLIGGSKTSAHLEGRAADIRVVGMDPHMFSNWILHTYLGENWPIDQVIYEGTWTHCGIAAKPRGQFLTAHFGNGGVTYTEGVA